MGNQNASAVPTSRFVTVKLAPETASGRRLQHEQDDTCIYQISVQAANEKSAGAFEVIPAARTGTTGNPLKFYPAEKPLPAQADCFVQLWEIDDWGDQGNSRRFDQYYPCEDRDDRGNRGKNRLVGTVGGVLTRDKTGRWKFVCLDDSGLPEVQSDSESKLLVRLCKPGAGSAAAEPKKVAVGVENESRWELGLHLTTNASEKKFETAPFEYPICFVESLRNLIRMQLAEGGLTISCYADLNLGGTLEPILKTYEAELKKIEEAIEKARAAIPGRVKSGLQAAAAARAAGKLDPLKENDVAAFEKEQTTTLDARGAQLKKKVQGRVSRQSKENYETWRERVTVELQQAEPSARHVFLASVQAKYGLTEAQLAELEGSGVGTFYEDLPLPAENAGATKKTMFDVQNDHEFGREAEELALEFGFITVKDGVVTKGSRAVRSPKEWLDYVEEVRAAVRHAYPEICPVDAQSQQVVAPKVYRLAILTHGIPGGIKFVDSDAPQTDVWFRKKQLNEDEGRALLDGLARCLAANAVVTLYACNTAANENLATVEQRILNGLISDDKESLKKDLAALPRKAPNLKQLRQGVMNDHARALKQAIADEKSSWPKTTYQTRLASYGGDPGSSAHVKNTMGEGSFAKEFRDELATRDIAANVWGHTDPDHASRNARMRLFASDGETYDFVRLLFADSGEFKTTKQPSEAQLSWWWSRGKEDNPLDHQLAVKKTALCPVESLQDDQRAFSLKMLIATFNRWYSHG
jgi:hypothetical protein